MSAVNRLGREKSPYLLKHAHNPVDWYPWGEEALGKAKNDGKPIFLSIGYSTCHWCTVMERESFEDPRVAAFLNRHFIPIKVDREERPEVDAHYMGAVQAMTGGGGWPLSVFLTPELKPFYGGTYYPPEPRQGMPSFMQVLEFVAKLWKDRKQEVMADAERVVTAITAPPAAAGGALDGSVLDEGYNGLVSSLDPAHGGFGGAPKFPLPTSLSFLLRYWKRTEKGLALSAVTKSLDGMAAGGIRDHLGGGFHRYSTDRVWLVPHFEKMLYDNALLARAYTEGHLATKSALYGQVVRETLGWLTSEMKSPEGGFYSAQDADTEAGEGTYYTWTPDEVRAVLGDGEGEDFCRAYGVTKTGNFEGRSILHRDSVGAAEDGERLSKMKRRLYEARVKRPRPPTDTKVLTSWNGLAISSLAYAGRVFGEETWVRDAAKAADFVLKTNSKEGKLLRRFAGGEAAFEGTIEDYAYLTYGLADLFESSGDPRWLSEAVRLARLMVEGYQDREDGGFFLTVDSVPSRLKETYDGPTPSGNAAAVASLVRLGELTGDPSLRAAAEKGLAYLSGEIQRNPTAHTFALSAVDTILSGGTELVISAPTTEAASGFLAEASSRFVPEGSLVVATDATYEELTGLTSLLDGRKPGPKARAFLCRGFVCNLPAASPEELARQMDAR